MIDFILHIDKHLAEIISTYGTATYLILFAIVFCETGLVITPFLPGDSLLFAAGALSANPANGLSVWLMVLILTAAAILGDTVNYFIGAYIGTKVFDMGLPFLKKEYLDRTHQFYEKYGGKTIILARFVPIVRTFAPFVAGVGHMNYAQFIMYNVIGGVVWVVLFTFAGYFFGGLQIIQDNFIFVTLGIIAISVLPMVYEYVRHRREKAGASEPLKPDHAA